MLPIGMTSSLQQLFTLICLFYIGSIIAEPARETLGASLADARARGSYMGFSRSLAFGGALGYAGGGWLFDAGKAVGQPELPWLMLGAIGVITFGAMVAIQPETLCLRYAGAAHLMRAAADSPAFSLFCWRDGC